MADDDRVVHTTRSAIPPHVNHSVEVEGDEPLGEGGYRALLKERDLNKKLRRQLHAMRQGMRDLIEGDE